jgi:hypothetical protein
MLGLALVACGDDTDPFPTSPTTTGTGGAGGTGVGGAGGAGGSEIPLDPDTAPVASVDRFSDAFATLFKRSGPAFDPVNVQPLIPAENEPFDMDTLFTVKALGPAGEKVTYYALDILPPTPGKGYVLVDEAGQPITDQLPIIEGLPGDTGYNDFVQITEVTVDTGYVANTITSAADVAAAVEAGTASMTETTRIANWSVVPKGTMAAKKFAGVAVTGYRAWYDDKVAHYLQFDTELEAAAGTVPSSGIIVIFADDMSPMMGFAAEPDGQTHNALETLPGDPGYSSYWSHSRGALAGFDTVTDFPTATANIAGPLPVIVNCPVVAP